MKPGSVTWVNVLTPFMHMHIQYVVYAGIEVEYAGQLDGFPPGKMVIRCLLLLWTGDYLAQSQVGKFIQGGMRPCRRCNLVGKLREDTIWS